MFTPQGTLHQGCQTRGFWGPHCTYEQSCQGPHEVFNLEITTSSDGVQTFYHPTLNHDRVRVRVRNETINHIKIRIRVMDSSPLAISSCYKVYVIRCLVIKCLVMKCPKSLRATISVM